jgi:Sugar-tranasporters, 12 TM
MLTYDVLYIYMCVHVTYWQASMYTFVFIWTPALQEVELLEGKEPDESKNIDSVHGNLGIIFATYMVSQRRLLMYMIIYAAMQLVIATFSEFC